MRWRKISYLLALCIVCLTADVLFKVLSYYYLPPLSFAPSIFPYGGIAVFHDFLGIDFCLTYVMNKGAAWGVFSSYQHLLLYVRLVVILLMALYLCIGKMPLMQRYGFALILTGAVGNVIDFFVYGHVVDMFYFTFWGYSYPVFNIADICICTGVGLLLTQPFFLRNGRSSLFKSTT